LHCRFFRSARGGRYWVQSLTRKERTFHAGAPITRAVLHEGDTVALGNIELRMLLGKETR
jgi:hypothetical protein